MSDPESKAHEEHESDDSSSDSEPETTTVEQPVEIDYTKLTAISPEVISKQVCVTRPPIFYIYLSRSVQATINLGISLLDAHL